MERNDISQENASLRSRRQQRAMLPHLVVNKEKNCDGE